MPLDQAFRKRAFGLNAVRVRASPWRLHFAATQSLFDERYYDARIARLSGTESGFFA
jgi:hypothetical protein